MRHDRRSSEIFNRKPAMRETETHGWMVPNSSKTLLRALRLVAVAAGIGFVMTAEIARAQEDEDQQDDSTFEEKVIKGIMTGLGGTNMENRGIEYRERSPLVVPPKLDLPPPASASAEVTAPNWPKDPDIQQRKAAKEARKQANRDPLEASRVLMPSELAQKGKKTASASADSNLPGDPGATAILSPSELGFNGSLSTMFKGNTSETAPFKGEPTRETLTQPPTGYQTPSPNYAYGTGPQESLNKDYNPAAGQYGD
jgi:hypothetical protein